MGFNASLTILDSKYYKVSEVGNIGQEPNISATVFQPGLQRETSLEAFDLLPWMTIPFNKSRSLL